MIINLNDYRDKVLGCWMGKNIGGTLGMPTEWKRQINDVTFYTQDLHGEPLPNDDLDIQLLWLRALEDHGPYIGTQMLSEYFLSFVTAHCAEYGTSKVHMRAGLMPPVNSIYDGYRDSCGAFIRSEIWACIAPGCPELAARYAYEDAIIDHGSGEGIYAELFTATVESAAFVEKDTDKLIEIGLSYIPKDCGVACAVRRVVECYKNGMSRLETRDTILKEYRGHYAAWEGAGISQRDRDMGFADGKIGYDAPSNIAMIIIGWLYGEGDFAKSICIAVNCGEDTDCTAATLGSILGILSGIQGIPKKWITPIGRGIKTMMLADFDVGRVPQDIDDLSNRVERIAKMTLLAFRPDVVLHETQATNIAKDETDKLFNQAGNHILRNMHGPIYQSGFLNCLIEYPDGPVIRDGGKAKVNVRVGMNLQHGVMIHMKWYLPEGFTISPYATGLINCPYESEPIEFIISAEGKVEAINRFVIELTAPGRHTVALFPVVLINMHE